MAACVAGPKVCAMKLDTMKPVHRDEPGGPAGGGTGHVAMDGIARAISLGLAAVVVAFVLVHPVSPVPGERLLDRALAPVMLLGALGGVAYGLGFRPRRPLLATLVGPFVSWPLMLSALAFAALAPGA